MKKLWLLLVLLMIAATAGPPPLPSSFWGTIEVDGTPVAEGTIISVWIGGVKYGECQASIYQDWSGVYHTSNVPGDQVGTDQVEGGVEGDVITFRIDDLVAQETAVWHSGTVERLDLTGITLESRIAGCREQCRQYRGWYRWRCMRWCRWLGR